MKMRDFSNIIWNYYKKYGRDLPWRHNITPYRIVVSEVMLQQTQVSRVTKKFDSFLKKFPNWKSLAQAPVIEVLKEWQGLGYNRRALHLHRLAQMIGGKLPRTHEELLELPGIGPNTAGSVLAFAFNIPHPFIETNIRAVFIHFFFKNSRRKVHDRELMQYITQALQEKRNQENSREWYYALMDYGCFLKQTEINPSRRSKHHTKQSKFEGSNRELRSHILKMILQEKRTKRELLKVFSDREAGTITRNLFDLEKEGFIKSTHPYYEII